MTSFEMFKKVPNSFGETCHYSKAHDASMGKKKIACLNSVIKFNVRYRSSFESTFTLGVFDIEDLMLPSNCILNSWTTLVRCLLLEQMLTLIQLVKSIGRIWIFGSILIVCYTIFHKILYYESKITLTSFLFINNLSMLVDRMIAFKLGKSELIFVIFPSSFSCFSINNRHHWWNRTQCRKIFVHQ